MPAIMRCSNAKISLAGTAPRASRVLCRGSIDNKAPHPRSIQQESQLNASILALSSALLPITLPLNSLAEEAATSTSSFASDIATKASEGPGLLWYQNPLELGLAFSPLLLYAPFYLFREKVNPKAKFGDYIFILAAVVIFGNIFSILVLKKRLY